MEAEEKHCSGTVHPPKKEDEDAGVQIEEVEKDYFLELFMGGSAPSEGAAERPAAVSSKMGQPAKKEATRGDKPALSKGKRKGSGRNPKGGKRAECQVRKERGQSAGRERARGEPAKQPGAGGTT